MKILFLLLFPFTIFTAQDIVIDGFFDDWQDIPVLYGDPGGDPNCGVIDFTDLKITDDDSYLYLYFKVGGEFNLQENNSIRILLDTDMNSATGLAYEGMGAEITFDFGSRSGRYYYNSTSRSIRHQDIGLVSGPTISSDVFEVILKKNTAPGGFPVPWASALRIALLENNSCGDRLPDIGFIEYSMTNAMHFPFAEYSLKKQDSSHIRVMSYNIELDGLFDPAKKEYFRQVFRTADPDIIGLQEIYNNGAAQISSLLEEFLPSGPGEMWHVSGAGADTWYAGRYPVKQVFPIQGIAGTHGNTAFLLDLSAKTGSDLLLVSAHTPCCQNNAGRQDEIDAIMAFIRKAKDPDEAPDIETGTPVILAGDFNLVGYAEQLETLVKGNIKNESGYGPDFNPDWDETDFEDAVPGATGEPSAFTWYDTGSSYSPGRLDVIIYSGSVLTMQNKFVMFSPSIPEDSLQFYGMSSASTVSAADHCPLIADFKYSPLTGIKNQPDSPGEKSIRVGVYPNPFNAAANFSVNITESSNVRLFIYNSIGEEISMQDYRLQAGTNTIYFEAANLPSGLYFYVISAEFSGGRKINNSGKIILLK